MNFVGHIHIAEWCLERHGHPTLGTAESEPSGWQETVESIRSKFLLGTALPDFAAIGRFQLRNRPADAAISAGIDVHHSTDTAFHSNSWFVSNAKSLGDNLKARGINRGAARACGHVGVELLLDGQLLARHHRLAKQAQGALNMTSRLELDLHRLVDEKDHASWAHHLRRIGSWSVPTDYLQAGAVAERLYRILQNRPRLAFDRKQIEDLAQALAGATNLVAEGIDDMIDTVAAEVAQDASGGRWVCPG